MSTGLPLQMPQDTKKTIVHLSVVKSLLTQSDLSEFKILLFCEWLEVVWAGGRIDIYQCNVTMATPACLTHNPFSCMLIHLLEQSDAVLSI